MSDPDCEHCHGTGIIRGVTHQVIPEQPGAAWWRDNDRVCECSHRTVIADSRLSVHPDPEPFTPAGPLHDGVTGAPTQDRGLSARQPDFLCGHLCCRTPNDPTHQHLFGADECWQCRVLAAEAKKGTP